MASPAPPPDASGAPLPSGGDGSATKATSGVAGPPPPPATAAVPAVAPVTGPTPAGDDTDTGAFAGSAAASPVAERQRRGSAHSGGAEPTHARVLAALTLDDADTLAALLTSSEAGLALVNNTVFPGVLAVVSSVSVLHRACSVGATACVAALVELGADPWVPSVVAATALTTGNSAVDFCDSGDTLRVLVDAVRATWGNAAAETLLPPTTTGARQRSGSSNGAAANSSTGPGAAAGQAGSGAVASGSGGGDASDSGSEGEEADENEVEDKMAAAVVELIEEDGAGTLSRLFAGAGRRFLNQRIIQSGAFHWQAPLHVACAKGSLQCVRALTRLGADPWFTSAGLWNDGWSAWKWCGGDEAARLAVVAGLEDRKRAFDPELGAAATADTATGASAARPSAGVGASSSAGAGAAALAPGPGAPKPAGSPPAAALHGAGDGATSGDVEA